MAYKILSVEAWRDPEGGWTWNAWYDTGERYESHWPKTPREVFARLRELTLLSEASKGNMALEDDGYNLVVTNRNTREPIFAIEYGAEE